MLSNSSRSQFESTKVVLKRALKSALDIDVEGLSAREMVTLAEVYCSIQFKPDIYYKDTINKSGNNLAKAEESFIKATAELDAYTDQFEIGQVLAEGYEHGDMVLHISPDRKKREKFGRFAKDPDKKKKITTEDVYNKFLWFTRVRLFLVRLNRVLDISNHAFLTGAAKTIASIASLSYFGEFFFDLGVAGYAALAPSAEQRRKTPNAGTRFINSFRKDDRPLRMYNALWGLANLIALFTSTAFAAGLNLGFFNSDFFVDKYKFWRDRRNHNRLLDKIRAKKEEYKAQLTILNKLPDDTMVCLKKARLEAQIAKQERVEDRLLEMRKANSKNRLWLLAASTLILAGMTILCLPHVAPVAALALFAGKMTGSYLALSGSIVGGLGKGLINRATTPGTLEYRTIHKITDTLFGRKKPLLPSSELEMVPAPTHDPDPFCRVTETQVNLLRKKSVSSEKLCEMSRLGLQKTSFFKTPPPSLRTAQSTPNFMWQVKKPEFKRGASAPIPVKRAQSVRFQPALDGDCIDCFPENNGIDFVDDAISWPPSPSPSR